MRSCSRLAQQLQVEAPERNRQRALVLSTVAERALEVMAAAAAAAAGAEAGRDAMALYAQDKDTILGALFGDAVYIDRQGLCFQIISPSRL